MKSLYVSDLDGTLLRNDARLSEFAREGINRLLKSNVHFTIATARSVISMRKTLGEIPFALPVIEFNGSFISDYHTGRHEVINSLGEDIVRSLYALFSERGLLPFLSTFNGKADRLYYTQMANGGMDWYLMDRTKAEDSRLRHVTDLKACLSEKIVCFTLIDRREVLEGIAKLVDELYSAAVKLSFFENKYSPGWFWLTIHDKRSSKDQAVSNLVARLGLSTNDLTVFGDDVNDLPMFKIAGRAVAVGNAAEEVRKHAHEIIGTNEDDSVVKYILGDLNLE